VNSKKSVLLMIFLLIVLTGCAHHYLPETFADPYGFFSGIWHGAIFSITLMVNILSWLLSLVGITFLDDIQIIGRPNTGIWYYVGFFLGLVTNSAVAR
jgi:hypothetical protein